MELPKKEEKKKKIELHPPKKMCDSLEEKNVDRPPKKHNKFDRQQNGPPQPIFFDFLKKNWTEHKKKDIGATIRICQEIQCFPYAGFTVTV